MFMSVQMLRKGSVQVGKFKLGMKGTCSDDSFATLGANHNKAAELLKLNTALAQLVVFAADSPHGSSAPLILLT